MKKHSLLLMTLILSLISLSACGSSSSSGTSYGSTIDSVSKVETSGITNSFDGFAYSDDDYDYDNYEDYDYYEEYESEDYRSDSSSTVKEADITLLEEKLVYRCDLNIETTDYKESLKTIKDTIKKYNGVIQTEVESDNDSNWYYNDYVKRNGTLSDYLEVRVPSVSYNDLLDEVGSVGKVKSKSSSIDNISQAYYSSTTEVKALEIERDRLLSMMEQCEEMSDIMTIESRLYDVERQINNLTTEIKYMDMDVAYSYVNISLNEVVEYSTDKEPVKTNKFIDRLKNTIHDTFTGFGSFLESLLFFIINLIPYLILLFVIYIIYKFGIKKLIKKFKKSDNTSMSDLDKLIKYIDEQEKLNESYEVDENNQSESEEQHD